MKSTMILGCFMLFCDKLEKSAQIEEKVWAKREVITQYKTTTCGSEKTLGLYDKNCLILSTIC